MAQESTMICVDNSDWMRNGDLQPTRFSNQQEAVRALMHYKLRSNPENAVGLLSLANRINVLSSLSPEDRKLQMRLLSMEIGGVALILDGIKTAYLALKHRKSRNHRQRIVVFIGSPLDPLLKQEEDFAKFAKKLKKEKVSVDFVLFGEATAENNKLITDFINTLNGADGTGSHVLVVPAGDTKLYDALLRSPICEGTGAAGGAAAGPVGDFGINDEDDPELAMALRISLEEQRLRQQQPQGGDGGAAAEQPAEAAAAGQPQVVEAPMEVDQQQQQEENIAAMTEEQLMERAIRMSLMENQPAQGGGQAQQPAASSSRSPTGAMSTPAPTPMETEEGSAGGASATGTSKTGGGGVNLADLIKHPEMLRHMVDQVPVPGQQQQQSASAGEGKSKEKEAKDKKDKKAEDDKKKDDDKDGGASKQ